MDRFTTAGLEELKNNTLLLTTANEHLTEEIFLVKIGNNISRAVELLERDISALKKEYPGKFVNDVDTDSILERIDGVARRMIKPGRDILDNHLSGALGREMEAHLSSIRKAVEEIKVKVRGSHTARSGKGAAIGLNPVRTVVQSVGGIVSIGIKILACLMVLAGVAFAYLYLTMEKDTVYINEIRISSTIIKDKKDTITSLKAEREGLEGQKKTMKIDPEDMTREEKVSALDVEMKIKGIDDDIDQLEAEISVQEKSLGANQGKLDSFRSKSFMERLLKQ